MHKKLLYLCNGCKYKWKREGEGYRKYGIYRSTNDTNADF